MNSGSVVTFPSATFESGDDFRRFRSENRDLFDERYRREQSLGNHDTVVLAEGVCGPCLEVTNFSSLTRGGELTADGRKVPHWRQTQACGCSFGLTSHERALIHAALPHFGKPSWFRAGILGAGDPVAAYVSRLLPDLAHWKRLARGTGRALSLPVSQGSQHMVLAADVLPHIIPLREAVAAVADALSPGGMFVFSTPFDVEANETVSFLANEDEADSAKQVFSAHPIHRLGWDLIPLLNECGFSSAVGHCYWSEEFGYLGPYNMVFVAHR
jgi:hypothetical protein